MKVIISFLVFFYAFSAFAQKSKELWFRPIHSIPNFSPSFNYFIHQDREGFVWIGSTAGLNRYDGSNVKIYNTGNSNLADDNILSNFIEDNEGNIWFSTTTALHCYQRATDKFEYILADSLPGQPKIIHAFFLEKNSFLWYSTNDGIYRYDIKNEKAKQVIDGPARWCVVDTTSNGDVVFLYKKGTIAKSGFKYWKINKGEAVEELPWFDDDNQKEIPQIINDIITIEGISWVGTDKGLIKWDRNKKIWKIITEHKYQRCWLAQWGKNKLVGWSWRDGLFIFDISNNSIEEIIIQSLEQTDLIYQKYFDLYVDHAENLWIPFRNSGLMVANLNKTKFRSIKKNTTINGKYTHYSYLSFLEDKDGTIWHGSNTAGLLHINGKGRVTQQFMPDANDPRSQWVTSMAYGKGDRIWVSSRGGLSFFDSRQTPIKFISVKESNNPKVLDAIQLANSFQGLLLTTANAGIFRIDETESNPKLVKVWDVGSPFTAIYEDSNRNVYASRNEEKIEVFTFQKDGTLEKKDSLPIKGYISGFWEDTTKNILWIGSFSGLVKVSTDSMKILNIYTEKDGLPSKNIHGILADDYSNLWLTTPHGLVKFIDNKKFRTYSLADGTLSTEFNLSSVLRKKNGDLWFGGANGITIVPAGKPIDDVKTEPKIEITGIEINYTDQPYHLIKNKKEFILPYHQNNLTFKFAGMEYSDPSNNKLGYFLEGADKDTVYLDKGATGVARFPDLRHGDYTLWLMAANSDGIWNKAEPFMHITIKPPLYLRWWAILLYVLIFLGIIYAYYRFRITQFRKKEEMLRKEEAFKRKEAELNLQMAETETAILRLQMNPHFIFNSMNSINSYILKKDIDTASDYLSRFSKLIRMILDFAANPYISVYEEADLLELYMQTEAMRFEDKFSHEIKVDDDVDPDDTILPTMILQPFVENAIWHGLSGKDGKGKVIVHFQKQNGSLVCSVEDNGRGMEAAKAGSTGKKEHVSKALGITKERLERLEKESGKPANYEIIDLKGADGKATGTKVVLILPLL